MINIDDNSNGRTTAVDRLSKRERLLTEEIRMLKQRVSSMEREQQTLTQAVDTLSQSEEKYRTIFNTAAHAMTSVDDQGMLLDCNDRIFDLLGYKREELLNESMAKIIHPDCIERAKGNLYELVTTGIAFNKEYQMIRKDGSLTDVCVNSAGIFDNEGHFVRSICIIENISERKQAEKKLIDYQARLKTLVNELTLAEERERRRIAEGIHDNIAQSLAMIKLNLEQLRSTTQTPSDMQLFADVFEHINKAIEDAQHLTFDLGSSTLYISGLEAAIGEWLEEVIEKQHHIAVKFEIEDISERLDLNIRVLIYRVVRELLINVVKHANAKQVHVRIFRQRGHLHIEVKDDGIGFNPQDEFAPDKTGGFGLFSIQERLNYLGGDMDIQSTPGQGACFTLTVPLTHKHTRNDGSHALPGDHGAICKL